MHSYFDLITYIGIIITLLPAGFLLWHRFKDKKSWEARYKTASTVVAIFLLIAGLTIIYGTFIEPRMLVVTRQTIELHKVEKPFTIALVTDMHFGPYKKEAYAKKIADTILELNPDMVFFGGDALNNWQTAEDETKYLEPLRAVIKKIPSYSINGNHEWGIYSYFSFVPHFARQRIITTEVKNKFEEMGAKYLVNDLVTTTIHGQTINIFGGDELWSENLKFDSLKKIDKNNPTIALIHNPAAVFAAADKGIDLFLAGHTHGGQIRLPFIGPLGRVDNVVPLSWYKGLHIYNGMKFYVSVGTGETGPRARLFNPPEVVLLTIE